MYKLPVSRRLVAVQVEEGTNSNKKSFEPLLTFTTKTDLCSVLKEKAKPNFSAAGFASIFLFEILEEEILNPVAIHFGSVLFHCICGFPHTYTLH